MKTNNTISNISTSTSSRNGSTIFCSNFIGRNIGGYSGNSLHDVIEF